MPGFNWCIACPEEKVCLLWNTWVVNTVFNPKQNGICPTNPLIHLRISHGFLQLQAQWILFLHLKIATVRTVGNLLLTTGICLTRTITTLGDHHLITFQWGQWTSLTIRWNIYCLKCSKHTESLPWSCSLSADFQLNLHSANHLHREDAFYSLVVRLNYFYIAILANYNSV